MPPRSSDRWITLTVLVIRLSSDDKDRDDGNYTIVDRPILVMDSHELKIKDEREQGLGTRHVARLWTVVLDSFLSSGNQSKV